MIEHCQLSGGITIFHAAAKRPCQYLHPDLLSNVADWRILAMLGYDFDRSSLPFQSIKASADGPKASLTKLLPKGVSFRTPPGPRAVSLLWHFGLRINLKRGGRRLHGCASLRGIRPSASGTGCAPSHYKQFATCCKLLHAA